MSNLITVSLSKGDAGSNPVYIWDVNIKVQYLSKADSEFCIFQSLSTRYIHMCLCDVNAHRGKSMKGLSKRGRMVNHNANIHYLILLQKASAIFTFILFLEKCGISFSKIIVVQNRVQTQNKTADVSLNVFQTRIDMNK